MAGMRVVMGKAGAGNMDMSTIETIEEREKNPSKHLGFRLGDGNSDHNEQGSRNASEFVNPGQTA